MQYESGRFHARRITEALSSGIEEDGDSPDFLGDMASGIPSDASPFDIDSDDENEEVRGVMDFMMPTHAKQIVCSSDRDVYEFETALSFLSDAFARDDREGVLETGEHEIPLPQASVEMRRACSKKADRFFS